MKSKKVIQFNSRLRIKIAVEIYKFVKNASLLINDGLIINHLRKLIEQSPYFGRLNNVIILQF